MIFLWVELDPSSSLFWHRCLYPLHWQQIFIPALPAHLLAYCAAPVPYLIGVHNSLLTPAVSAELEGVVLLDADENHVTSCYDDVSSLPNKLVKYLTKQLKTRESFLLGDTVSRAFFNTLVLLIGDYHAAVTKQEDGRSVFNGDDFVASRPAKFRRMLTTLMSSQAFHQFIDERIDVLNSCGASPQDMFEEAVSRCREIGSGARTTMKV